MRWSDGSFLEDQDHWRMAGMYREVMVYSVPEVYLADVFAKPSLDADYTDGALDVVVRLGGTVEKADGWLVGMQLFDANNQPLFSSYLNAAFRYDYNEMPEVP